MPLNLGSVLISLTDIKRDEKVVTEESMATHSSVLAWRIPWTEEPGRLQSTGSRRVRHNRSDLACMHAERVYPSLANVLVL